MNTLPSDVIENAGGELREEHIQEIRNQFGAKAVSQAKRMIRQQFRHRQVEEVVDDCIRVISVNDMTYKKLGRMGIAHIYYHLQFGIVDCDLKERCN